MKIPLFNPTPFSGFVEYLHLGSYLQPESSSGWCWMLDHSELVKKLAVVRYDAERDYGDGDDDDLYATAFAGEGADYYDSLNLLTIF